MFYPYDLFVCYTPSQPTLCFSHEPPFSVANAGRPTSFSIEGLYSPQLGGTPCKNLPLSVVRLYELFQITSMCLDFLYDNISLNLAFMGLQVKSILALWKELREVRQKQGFSNTTTKIIIRKVSLSTFIDCPCVRYWFISCSLNFVHLVETKNWSNANKSPLMEGILCTTSSQLQINFSLAYIFGRPTLRCQYSAQLCTPILWFD